MDRRSASLPRAGSCRRTSSKGASPLTTTFQTLTRSPSRLDVFTTRQYLVHDSVLYRFLGTHEKVAVRVALDDFQSLARVLHQDLVQPAAQEKDFLGVDLDVRCLALEAAHGLVDHDARVGQAEALVLIARRQKQRPHA